MDSSDSTFSSPIPQHVAIIMDGNGRWAKQRGLARMEGHEAGTENIRLILRHAGECGVRYLTLWAFSTENWRRPEAEVAGLMRILGKALVSETEELHRQGAQLRHIGDLTALDPELAASVREAMALTAHNDRIILTIAFNYGGRQELLHAVKGMLRDQVDPETVDEDIFQKYLYMPELPDPDLIVRTSGEYRISNFLLWQGAYSELHFTSKYWPDFTPEDFDAALADYASRERRFGATSAQVQAQ
ncbi:MAG: polyprenyl diphosphate synthase [Thermomicrobiales bacterium]|nr:polyprenyl diphosphate synthase [Thermomicrobiales bacterium]MCO5219240.1 polyprenyl diphosphate synthase [Thermomicrobiales bacterium]MCO5228093.1 polyprenyl diphosphate synthase [Thermomicrobiales bacterium]